MAYTSTSSSKAARPAAIESEFVLHRAWHNLEFDRANLRTTAGLPLRIHNCGKPNPNQGPDFLDAEIEIGSQRMHGHVEIHIAEDDWRKHRHHIDKGYDAVVLHVFHTRAKLPCLRSDGTSVPGLCLEDRLTPTRLLLRHSQHALPCHGLGKDFLPVDHQAWIMAEGKKRILEKAGKLSGNLESEGFDWSGVLWKAMAVAMAGPVNSDAFGMIASKANWQLVRGYTHSRSSMEAILLGVGGILDGRPLDSYSKELQTLWDFLKQKHRLQKRQIPLKLHRMHPAGFPTLRLAQLAWIAHIFRPLCSLIQIDGMQALLDSRFGEDDAYWSHRYQLGNTTRQRRSELGMDAKVRLITNVLAPLYLASSSLHHLQPDHGELFAFLGELPPESNRVVSRFSPIGLVPRNALASQGLIHLNRSRCLGHKCLSCPIGSRAMGKLEA